MKKSYALDVSHLNFSFFDNVILDDLNFKLREGEIHALLGQNATGKSTLVKLLAGIIPCQSGTISIFGRNFYSLDIQSARQHGIYTINQDIQLIRNLTVEENIYLQTVQNIYLPKRISGQFQKLKELFQINIDGRALVKTLSAGEKRLVELMRAYVFQPKILILDEPAAYFSTVETRTLHRILKKMQSKGTSILYITHKIKDALSISDRISVLYGGNIVNTFLPEAFDDSSILSMMTGQSHKNRFPKIPFPKGEPLLTVSSLASPILQDISFTLHEGEILGITGISGAGKSLLGQAIMGLTHVSGQVFYHPTGQIIRSEQTAAKHGIGYIAEEAGDNNVPQFLARMNITLADLGRMCSHGFIQHRSERAIEKWYFRQMNFTTAPEDRPTHAYSGGEQQKISLARHFFKETNVLIVDEPTKFVDIPSKNDIYNLFNQYTSQKKGIIILSSDFSEICGMCDRILVLHYGRIVKELNQADASEELVVSYALAPQ